MNRFILFLAALCPLLAFAAAPTKPFELRDGDRVVFIGDTLMEREKDYGYIELMMTLRFPERNVTFRNLGWSADTPVGISRVSFDWPKGEAEMSRVLMEQIKQVQPNGRGARLRDGQFAWRTRTRWRDELRESLTQITTPRLHERVGLA